jgi:glycosyltransferase involved in cell wall biosynthesis
MSFLEAMALGAVVIAANRPTMNEYITSGENGILFEPLVPSMIDFDKIGNISENAKDSIAEGRRKWDEKEEELLDFIASPPTIHRLRKNTEIRRMRPFPVFIGVLKRLGLLKILKSLLPYGLVAYLKRKK